MKTFTSFKSDHSDLIHDIAYDYYGKRLATCSSDQTIKVWDLDEKGEKPEWKLSSSYKPHNGTIYKIAWAHPEFGQVIASCSFDKTVQIWEEISDEKGDKSWTKHFHIAGFRDSVLDLQFSPKHLMLKLATACADGFIRVYEATDVTNLDQWTLIDEFEGQKGGCCCLSWNSSPLEQNALMVVGSQENAKIWEYHETHRKWQMVEILGTAKNLTDIAWAPNFGRSFHLIATASKDKTVRLFRVAEGKGKWDVKEIAVFGDHNAEVWRVEWNITGTVLASSGDDGSVRLWKATPQGEWKQYSKISGENPK